MGKSVMAFVLRVVQTEEIATEMNGSVIYLFSKKQHPEDISKFQPIPRQRHHQNCEQSDHK